MTIALKKPDISVAALEKRYQKAMEYKDQVKHYIEDAYRFFAPNRLTNEDGEKINADGMNEVFDSTPLSAFSDYASTVHSVVAPPGKKFFELAAGPGFKDTEKQELDKELESVTDVFFSYLGISNFDIVMGEISEDYGISTGCMGFHKGTKDNPFIFETVDFADYLIEPGPFGLIGGIWREQKVRGRDVMATWDDAELTAEMKERFEEKPDDFFKFRKGQVPSPIEVKTTDPETKKVVKQKVQGFKMINATGTNDTDTKDDVLGTEGENPSDNKEAYAGDDETAAEWHNQEVPEGFMINLSAI